MQVRIGDIFYYRPGLFDRFEPPAGVRSGRLKEGDLVKVSGLPSRVAQGTMGHVQIETLGGEPLGIASLASLRAQ